MTFLGEIIELYLQKGNFLENLMPFLNKEAKKTFSVKDAVNYWTNSYYKISGYLEVKEAFRKGFPQKDPHQQIGQYGKT